MLHACIFLPPSQNVNTLSRIEAIIMLDFLDIQIFFLNLGQESQPVHLHGSPSSLCLIGFIDCCQHFCSSHQPQIWGSSRQCLGLLHNPCPVISSLLSSSLSEEELKWASPFLSPLATIWCNLLLLNTAGGLLQKCFLVEDWQGAIYNQSMSQHL